MSTDPPLLTLRQIEYSLGGKPLLRGADLSLYPGERACLVGRNGAGKSTLMKIAAGMILPDQGEIWYQPGCKTAYLAQEPDIAGYHNLIDYVMADLEDKSDNHRHLAEAELMQFGLTKDMHPDQLSGGEMRRAALARAFTGEPDILLLDEPTNHMDIEIIDALEARLLRYSGAMLLVSHDRRFLENISTSCQWIRLGKMHRHNKGFYDFTRWSEKIEQEEAKAVHRLDHKLKQEYHWLVHGVSGRRARNQGRLRKLEEMRAEYKMRRSALQSGRATVSMALDAGEASGKKVLDIKGLNFAYPVEHSETKPIVKDLDLRLMRGDRLGIVGANGAGKSTLLKLILGELKPDSGRVRLGTNLSLSHLDQKRSQLNPEHTLWDILAPGGGDQIIVRGNPRHVAAYAQDFLFHPKQLRQPVRALSGGERNRLLLAVTLAHTSNMLVLDEPTNDLDMETLDLLEDMLAEYDGTLILVSHDRAFLDGVVTSLLTPIGEGRWIETAGGYKDSKAQLSTLNPLESGVKAVQKEKNTAQKGRKSVQNGSKNSTKMSYKHAWRLDILEKAIPKLEQDIADMESQLSDPELYSTDPKAFNSLSEALSLAKTQLEQDEMEWLELEEMRQSLEG